MADTNTRQGKRTPVTLKIKFKSETLEQFIERYAVDVSQGGIFIRTKEPLAVGTQMKFEFQLRDASPLIAGEGTVVWTRENDPSRPAIAPGMGVRFDRLSDGSQSVLEKILAEKAKQAPSRSGSVTAPGDANARAAAFTDTPTRVAPAALVQEALGGRSRTDSEQTPLPKPVPFQSDAEDFDEKAFDEATKVRSLDELALASATDDDPPSFATKIMPADELALHRIEGGGNRASDPPLPAPPDDTVDESAKAAPPANEIKIPRSLPDRDSAPGLPSPPAVEPARARPPTNPGVGSAGAARASTPSVPPVNVAATEGTTKVGIEPAKATTSQRSTKPTIEPDAPRAVSAESARPVAPSRPSSAPIIIGILVLAAAAIAGVWWFALRDPGSSEPKVVKPDTTGSTTTVTKPTDGSGAATGTTPTAAGSDMAAGSGSDAATGAGSDAGSAAGSATPASGSAAAPTAPTVDTVITASIPKGATVEVVGTDMKGPAPFTAKLEKGKAYKARVTAPGFVATEIDVKGGERATAKLAFTPRVVSITSDPPGAAIYVDGADSGKLTPAEVTLSAAQAGRPRVRISLRRTGFKNNDSVLDTKAWQDAGTMMKASIDAKLTVQPVVRPPTGGGTGSATGGDAPDGGGTGTGGDPAGGSTPPPAPTPPPADPAAGSATP